MFYSLVLLVRCVWHCCSWKDWRTATMMSCHFLLGHSPSTHLVFCKWPFFCLLIKDVLVSSCSWRHEIIQLTSSTLSRLFQLGGDLEDLESALNKSSQTRPLGSGSCSALIKLLPNNKELLVSHDTWNTYQAMLRIMKKYTFAFKASPLGSLPMQLCVLYIIDQVLESLNVYIKGLVEHFCEICLFDERKMRRSISLLFLHEI